MIVLILLEQKVLPALVMVALKDVLGSTSPMVPDALADVVADLFNLVLVHILQSSLRHNGCLILQRVSLRRLALLMIHLIVGLRLRLILLLN
jgi:hypothetical protein